MTNKTGRQAMIPLLIIIIIISMALGARYYSILRQCRGRGYTEVHCRSGGLYCARRVNEDAPPGYIPIYQIERF